MKKKRKKEWGIRLPRRKHAACLETPNQVATRRVLENIRDTRNIFGNIFVLHEVFFFLEVLRYSYVMSCS